jgi:hypothetical protein
LNCYQAGALPDEVLAFLFYVEKSWGKKQKKYIKRVLYSFAVNSLFLYKVYSHFNHSLLLWQLIIKLRLLVVE